MATRIGSAELQVLTHRHDAPEVRSSRADETARINNFDLIRLFGALQVAFVHALVHLKADALTPSFRVLGFFPGVPIFFAVSGFLVSLSLERANSVYQYFWNRALRIFPALWVCFVISVLIALLGGVKLPPAREFIVWTLAQLTVVQFYNPAWLRGFGVGTLNGSLWTISVELQFYLLLPLLALWARRNLRRWLLLMLVAGVVMLVLRAVVSDAPEFESNLVGVTALPFLFYFLVGVVLRLLHTAHPRLFRGQAWKYASIYVLWIAIEVIFALPGGTGNLLNPVSIVLLSCLVISFAFTNHTLASRLLGTTDISYGIYIYHMPLVNLFLANAIVGVTAVIGVLAVTAILATFSWFVVERPALGLKHYTLKRRK